MDRLDGWTIRPVCDLPDLGWGLFDPSGRLTASFFSLTSVARFAELLEVDVRLVSGVPVGDPEVARERVIELADLVRK